MESSVTLIKGDKHGPDTEYRDAFPVNMYPVIQEVLGANGYMLAYPGLSDFGNSSGIDRGANYNEQQEAHFRVSGESLIEVDRFGSSTSLGSISGADQASMPYSFNTQAVIADGKYFLYDSSGGFRQVTDPDLGKPIDAVWVDGYYFFTDGEFIYHTDINDEESIDPLKFATAEFMPDPSLGVAKTQDNKVIVFGRYTIEYFVNASTTNFAFKRVETRAQKIGIVATHAKTEADGQWYITGGRVEESIGVYLIGVGSSKKVSNREIDKILSNYTELDLIDMRMETRREKNTFFIQIHLPSDCLLYCPDTGSWTILETKIKTSKYPHRAINGIYDPRVGVWVYGDKRESKIGKLNFQSFTQYGDDPQAFELYTPFLKIESQSIDKIEIETIPGYTTTDDATVFLSLTYNGVIYGQEVLTEYGKQSDYSQRFIKRRLGYVPDRVGFKYRGLTRSRMAFGLMRITHG